MLRPAVLFIVAAISASAAFAQSQPSSAPSSGAPTTPGDLKAPAANQTAGTEQDKDALICRKMPPPTGTRLGGRTICLTQKQWDQQEKDSQEALRGVLQRGGGPGGPGADGGPG